MSSKCGNSANAALCTIRYLPLGDLRIVSKMTSGARAGKSTPSGATEEMDSSAPPMCWDIIQGIECIRPFAFAAQLSGPAKTTGFPSMAKRSH